MSADSLPGLLVARAAAAPSAVALRFFRQGKWNDVTLAQLHEKAATIGGGLSAHGVKSGEVVAVIAEDGPLFLAAELGAQGIGAVVLALDPALSAADVVGKVNSAGAVAVIAGDQEQFDKIDESRSDVPSVRLLAVDATRGLRELERLDRDEQDRTMTVAQLCAKGSVSGWASTLAGLTPSSPARTNGSTTTSHGAIIQQAQSMATRLGLTKTDALCSLQTVADSTEYALAVAGPLLSGSVLHFRGRATAQQAMRQVQPTVVHVSPQWLGRISADTDAQVARATGLKKFALAKGLQRKAAGNVLGSARRVNVLRLGGLLAAAAVVVMFALSSGGNDVVRVGVALLIAVVAGLVLLSAGHGVAGPIRRRYGLARCRAVLSSHGLSLPGADLLGALQVPLIDATQEVAS
jgi:long-chain acyl-CoA synthetase